MTFKRTLAPAGVALLLLLGAAPSVRAEAAPSAAGSLAQPAPARTGGPAAAPEDYATREAKTPELAQFEGGEHEHIYIGSSVVVVLLLVLIIVLVI